MYIYLLRSSSDKIELFLVDFISSIGSCIDTLFLELFFLLIEHCLFSKTSSSDVAAESTLQRMDLVLSDFFTTELISISLVSLDFLDSLFCIDDLKYHKKGLEKVFSTGISFGKYFSFFVKITSDGKNATFSSNESGPLSESRLIRGNLVQLFLRRVNSSFKRLFVLTKFLNTVPWRSSVISISLIFNCFQLLRHDLASSRLTFDIFPGDIVSKKDFCYLVQKNQIFKTGIIVN
ncbi:hypothetical protein BpHYR1_023276 [Brachionus plicatilis]|uniref:Uncharacterized protein n=1 Tax=Brachionus plicatilis TaxID=10195 RepID=A0A3M7Q565_BRAPC|nr:hypothetical protein BpHYR1_023276 [Brachionus plicatilis]